MKAISKLGVVAALAGLLVSGCIREAQIAVPSQLSAGADRIELTGMGGGERGRFRLAESEGRFTRLAVQDSLDDGFTLRNWGGGSFVVSGPDVTGELSARCAFDEEEHDAGIVTVTAERFAYRCRFTRDGAPIEAGLILEEVPQSPDRLLSGRTRAGEIHIDGHVIAIMPIHDMAGGRLPTGTPLGYRFDVDGRQIGAVDLNGLDKTIYAPRSGPEREAVLAASLALSILWDPGA